MSNSRDSARSSSSTTQAVAERLLRMRTTIDGLKEKRTKYQAQQDMLLTRLKDDFECKTLKEAEAKLTAWKEEAEADTTRLETLMDKLEALLGE